MSRLSHGALRHIDELARRHGFSADALNHLFQAVAEGDGRMAEFDHPEFGGPAMWMTGGMLMLSDNANHALKARVDAACNDIAALLGREPSLKAHTPAIPPASHQSQRQSQSSVGTWHSSLSMRAGTSDSRWPAELGTPSVTGSQNGLHYALFRETRRLAIDDGHGLRIYDTGDHLISDVSQQHSDTSSTLTLTSQHGPIALSDLSPVSDTPSEHAPAAARSTPERASVADGDDAIFTAIERLGELKERGLLTAEEFDAKKRDLLSRL